MTNVDTSALLRMATVITRVLGVLLVILIGAALFLIGAFMLDLEGTSRHLSAAVGYEGTVLRVWQAGALGALKLVQLGIWAAVIWRGMAIFRALQWENVTLAGHEAARTARLLWLMLGWQIVSYTLGVLAVTWHFPVGERALAIDIGTAQLSTALAALLAGFTAQAFALGAALWQDHKEVI